MPMKNIGHFSLPSALHRKPMVIWNFFDFFPDICFIARPQSGGALALIQNHNFANISVMIVNYIQPITQSEVFTCRLWGFGRSSQCIRIFLFLWFTSVWFDFRASFVLAIAGRHNR